MSNKCRYSNYWNRFKDSVYNHDVIIISHSNTVEDYDSSENFKSVYFIYTFHFHVA